MLSIAMRASFGVATPTINTVKPGSLHQPLDRASKVIPQYGAVGHYGERLYRIPAANREKDSQVWVPLLEVHERPQSALYTVNVCSRIRPLVTQLALEC